MSAKDLYHDNLKNALIKDGWTITDDPLVLKWGAKDFFVDLGAEYFLAAEKELRQIAVEIKSFIGPSNIEDLKNSLGQFILYHDVLSRLQPSRILYLAVRESTFDDLFEEPIGTLLLANQRVRLIVFEPEKELIIKWIP